MVRYRTIDDRGKAVRARWLWLAPGERAGRGARIWAGSWGEAWAGVSSGLGGVVPGYVWPVGLILVMVAGYVALVISWKQAALALLTFSVILSPVIGLVLTLLIWWWSSLRRHAALVRQRLRRQGRCPACLYDLSGIPIVDEALTPCPECGASWDMREPDASRVVVRAHAPRPG